MSLSKEQKESVIQDLSSLFKTVKLNCDGYEITLRLMRHKMKLIIAIYINGEVKGMWSSKPEEYPESKFLAVRKKSVYTPSEKAKILKEFGKRDAKKQFNIDQQFEYRLPYFSTARSALNHLIKVSESIEILTEMAA